MFNLLLQLLDTKTFNQFAPYPHNAETFRKRCRNIPWKYCKIAKIF